MVVMLCGMWSSSAHAADKWAKATATELATGDVVVIVDQTSSTAMPNSNGESSAPAATTVTLSGDKSEITSNVDEALQWVVTVTTEGTGEKTYMFSVADTEDHLYCIGKNNGVRVGTDTNNQFTIKQADVNNTNDYLYNTGTARYIGVYNSQDWRCYTTVHANIKETLVAFYKLSPDQSDSRPATTVTFGDHATTGEAGTTINLPTVTVLSTGDVAVSGAAVTWSSSDETVATISDDATQISLLTVGTTTIKATFAGDSNHKPSSARYKLTVTPAAIAETITSLKALQEVATTTVTPVTIQFTDVYVTAVKDDKAYLADAEGYGIQVYQSNHGLEAGQVLNGTVKAHLALFHSQVEVTNFSKDGLTITTTELTPTDKTIDQITAANQSTLVTIKNVVFSGGMFSDGTNQIDYYDNFDVGWLENEATYDITGIIIYFNNTLEISPRSADDIRLISSGVPPVERLDVTLSFPQKVYEITLGDEFTPPELTIEPADYDGMITYSSSDGDVATVSYDGSVDQVGPGTTVITVEATNSEKYNYATTSYTLIIKEPETPVTPDKIANPYTYTFESGMFAENGEAMLANVNWTLNTDAGYFGYDGDKGQQFGSAKHPATTITLSTSDIPGTITKIVVNTSGAGTINATFSVSVGETAFLHSGEDTAATTDATLTKAPTDYEFTGQASGPVTLSWANNSSKAIYVKSIYVEYTTEEESTAIRDIYANTDRSAKTTGNAVYDLQGRIQRSTLKKGLYIKDNKKVLVK